MTFQLLKQNTKAIKPLNCKQIILNGDKLTNQNNYKSEGKKMKKFFDFSYLSVDFRFDKTNLNYFRGVPPLWPLKGVGPP